jgi:thiol-disulfide isomerase/thioredoxin
MTRQFIRLFLVAIAPVLVAACSSPSDMTSKPASPNDPLFGVIDVERKPSPEWILDDFQPKSGPRFKTKYGPKEFRGKVLVVALTAGWCPYCQAQAGRMEALIRDLKENGKDVSIVGINSVDALGNQNELTSRTTIPLFQDDMNANGSTIDTAWELLAGKKDDLYIYDSKGLLAAHFRSGGGVPIDLTTAEGYRSVKDAIMVVQ